MATILFYNIYGIFFTLILLYSKNPSKFFGFKKLRININRESLVNNSYNTRTAYLHIIFICLATFLLFTVFRKINNDFSVGVDARTYRSIFLGATQSWQVSLVLQGMEPLYATFVWIVRQFTSDFKIFLFIYNILLFYLIYYFVKNSNLKINYYVLCSFFILIFTMILISLCLMRHTLSVFIAQAAIISISNKKWLTSILLFFCALLIHYASIILIISFSLFLLSGGKFLSIKKFWFLFIVSFILIFIIIKYLPLILTAVASKDRYMGYYNNEEKQGLLRYIFVLYLLFVITIKWSKIQTTNKLNGISLCIIASNLYIYPIQFVFPIAYRMLLFADISIFIIMAEIVNILKLKGRNCHFDVAIYASFIIYLAFYIIKFFSSDSYGILVYKNILF